MSRAFGVVGCLLFTALPLAGQQGRGARGDSVEIELTVVLAGGDPVASAWSRWIAPRAPGQNRGHAARAATGSVLHARASIDTRLPAATAATADGSIPVYASGLTLAEASAVTRALADETPPLSAVGGLTGVDDTALTRMTATLPQQPVPLERPRGRVMSPALVVRAAVPVHHSDWVHTETIRYRLPAGTTAGDTVWIVVGDRGTRRWFAPAIFEVTTAASASTAPAAITSTPTPPLRADVPLVFGVHQLPTDPRATSPGFARVARPTAALVAGGEGGTATVADPALVAAVRRFGITAVQVALPQPASVSVRIVDLTGRPVTTLGPQALDAGYWSVQWDGTRAGGARATPGVYLAITEALGVRVVTKLILAP